MTRVRPAPLPGSHGPFLGPAGKQIQEMEDSLRKLSIVPERGLVYGSETHSLITGKLSTYAVTSNQFMLYPLSLLPYKMRLKYVRVYMHVPSSGVAKVALYHFYDQTKVIKMASSEARLPINTAGEITIRIKNETFLEPGIDYFLGFTSPGGSFTSLVQGAIGARGLLPYFSVIRAELPPSLDLKDLTKSYLDGTGGVVCVSYLTEKAYVLM